MVAIFDADKEGFLRSETSLIQTIGRAARNADGRVILFADRITNSIDSAVKETERRRDKQIEFNLEHGITPQTIKKNVADVLAGLYKGDTDMARVTATLDEPVLGSNFAAHISGLKENMFKAAENLEFEEAARLRDEINRLEAIELTVADDPLARQSAVDEAANEAVGATGQAGSAKSGARRSRSSHRRRKTGRRN